MKQGKSDYDCPMCGKRSLQLGLTLTAPFQIPIAPEPTLVLDTRIQFSKKCLFCSFFTVLLVFILFIFLMIGRIHV